MTNFKPLGSNVLIEVPMIEEKTKAGIIKSASQIEAEKNAADKFLEVIAVGEAVKDISVGDKVMLSEGKHRVVTIEDKNYILVYSGLILGKLL